MTKKDNIKKYAAALRFENINLDCDFFKLTHSEQLKVDEVRRRFNFSGKNSAGRSPIRQFYYLAQQAPNPYIKD